MIRGEEIDIPSSALGFGGDEERLVGFYVKCEISAPDEQSARDLVMQSIQDEWTHGKYSKAGARPHLKVDEVKALGLLARLRRKWTGYVFFPKGQGRIRPG